MEPHQSGQEPAELGSALPPADLDKHKYGSKIFEMLEPNPHKPQPDCNTTNRCTGPNHSSLLDIHEQTLSLSVKLGSSLCLILPSLVQHAALCPLVLFAYLLPSYPVLSFALCLLQCFLILAGDVAAELKARRSYWNVAAMLPVAWMRPAGTFLGLQ
ncbi:unnamed protein product [Pleuronectes platessa]|uniref:Uncharacterized protein n=1 Tax=Pleuronectes platessa TaxID=8262 RepID=A0A9N7TUN3_PLEPL|nr:unnamed protein product [Pleuronectes platessa]